MTCPICRQSTSWKENPWRPFCSERCQLTDLGTWALERYRIPGPPLTLDAASPDSLKPTEDEDNGRTGQLK